jgi:signal transduction histidine kinase
MKNPDRSAEQRASEVISESSLSSCQKYARLSKNPLRLLIITVAAIFFTEFIVMFVISRLPSMPFSIKAIIDASLSLLFIFPVLYFFLLRPMRFHITEQDRLGKLIFEIEEHEQRRIGKRLHENLNQILTGAAFQLKVLEKKLEKGSPEDAQYAAEISSHINNASNEARLLAKDLRSTGADEESLLFALGDLASVTSKVYNIPCLLTHDKDIQIANKPAITHLYRIARQAVDNAVLHGNPGKIELSLSIKNSNIELKIQDDGSGFDKTSRQENGMGIQMMNYRAITIGASLLIRSDTKGTRVMCILSNKK